MQGFIQKFDRVGLKKLTVFLKKLTKILHSGKSHLSSGKSFLSTLSPFLHTQLYVDTRIKIFFNFQVGQPPQSVDFSVCHVCPKFQNVKRQVIFHRHIWWTQGDGSPPLGFQMDTHWRKNIHNIIYLFISCQDLYISYFWVQVSQGKRSHIPRALLQQQYLFDYG